MRRFEGDIVRFVHAHFERRAIPVYQLIEERSIPFA
jgi:hypothetical protein